MPLTFEQLEQQVKERFLKAMTTEERLRGLPAEEFLKVLPAEVRLRGMPAEELRRALAKLEEAESKQEKVAKDSPANP